MQLETINIPPVSHKFYNELIRTFRPYSGVDIKADTSIIEIHRRAAQDEVLNYIERAVVPNPDIDTVKVPLWTRIKRAIKYIVAGE